MKWRIATLHEHIFIPVRIYFLDDGGHQDNGLGWTRWVIYKLPTSIIPCKTKSCDFTSKECISTYFVFLIQICFQTILQNNNWNKGQEHEKSIFKINKSINQFLLANPCRDKWYCPKFQQLYIHGLWIFKEEIQVIHYRPFIFLPC